MSAAVLRRDALRPPSMRVWVLLLAVCVAADGLVFWRVFEARLPYNYQYDITPENEQRLRMLIEDVHDSWPDTRRFMVLVFTVKFDIGVSALPTLIEYSKHESPMMRQIALGCIGSLEDQTAVPAVIEAMDDPVPLVVFWACMTLGDLGDRSSLDALVAALDHPDYRVRAAAALNVGIVGPRPQDVEALIARIEDPHDQVGQTIQRALSDVCNVNPLFLGRSRVLWEQWWESTGRKTVQLAPA